MNEASGQTPLINSLRQTLEHDQEWLDNEASESMYTQTTADYVATDATAALASPGSAYGLNCQPFSGAAGAAIDVGSFHHKAFEIQLTTRLLKMQPKHSLSNVHLIRQARVFGAT